MTDRQPLLSDRRSVSPVVGAILLLAIAVTALSIYQLYSVPAQNSGIEFDHNQEVQSELTELRNSLIDVSAAPGQRDHRPVTVNLGTRYPQRIVAVNPPPASGTLSTQDRGTISIENAEIVGEFTGSPSETLLEAEHETRLLAYEPGYNEYQTAPTTIFEHSLLYNQFESANLSITEQRTVRGETRRLNLVLFEGDISEQGMDVTIDPETTDGPTDPVPISAVSGDSIEVALPTNSPAIWRETIGEEFDEAEPNARVSTADGEDGQVTLQLRDGGERNWHLQMTRVSIAGETATPTGAFSDIQAVETMTGEPSGTGAISPFQIADVRLDGEELIDPGGQTRRLRLDFRNVGSETRTIERARIGFLQGASVADEVELSETISITDATTVTVGGDMVDTDPPLEIAPAAEPDPVYLRFEVQGGNLRDTWFILTLEYDTGDRVHYFVTPG